MQSHDTRTYLYVHTNDDDDALAAAEDFVTYAGCREDRGSAVNIYVSLIFHGHHSSIGDESCHLCKLCKLL